MYNTVLVTAFFDIKRESYRKNPRSVSAYIEYFKRWARIKNYLVVFCGNEEIKQEVLKIRKNYGLENMTKVIVIENIFDIEPDMYARMKQIETDKYFLKFRKAKNVCENNANYNYITNLKCWFLYRASLEEDITFLYVAWIDFGFDYNGELFYDENDWSFELQANHDIDKVQIYYMSDTLEERPMFEVIRTVHPDSIAGGFFLCPIASITKLWDCIKKTIYSLLYIGLMDDDQPIFLLAGRITPELFEFHKSYWFYAVTYYGGGHMKVDNNSLNLFGNDKSFHNLLRRVKRKLTKIFKRFFAGKKADNKK